MAVGRGDRPARGGQRLEVGRDRPAADPLAEHVGAHALEHDDHDVGPGVEPGERRPRFGNGDELQVTAVAVLVDAVAGHVERQRVAGRVERMRVGRQANQAVAIAVEVGGERGEVRGRLPGQRALEAPGAVLGDAGDRDQRQCEQRGAGGQPAAARRPCRFGRQGPGKAPGEARGQPPGKRQRGERGEAPGDLVLAEQQRVGEAAAAELLEQCETHRVAEIGMQLVLRGQCQQPEPEIEEREAEQRLPAGPVAGELRAEPPGEERRKGLRDEVAGREQRELAWPVDRTRGAEPAGEHAVLAVGDGELDRAEAERGQRHERHGPQEARETSAQHGCRHSIDRALTSSPI